MSMSSSIQKNSKDDDSKLQSQINKKKWRMTLLSQQHHHPFNFSYTILMIFFVLVLLGMLFIWKAYKTIISLLFILPILMTLNEAIRAKTLPERLIAFSYLLGIFTSQLPSSLNSFLVVSILVVFGLSTRKLPILKENGMTTGHNSEIIAEGSHFPKALIGCLVLTIVLLAENFFVWVVSATYYDSHEEPYPNPLQDNGQIVLKNVLEAANIPPDQLQDWRNALNIQWALVSSIGACFVLLSFGFFKGRSLWSMVLQVVATIAFARAIRTIGFTLTVLPSQSISCYRSHFPYPPPEFLSYEWFKTGLIPQTKGGCNDLIISGHATITSAFACMSTTLSRNKKISFSIWFLLFLDFAMEVYQGYHYR